MIDAAAAVRAAGIDDRDRFRLALRACLSKSPQHCTAFDRLFDAFFSVPWPGEGRGSAKRQAGQRPGQRPAGRGQRAGQTPAAQGKPAAEPKPSEADRPSPTAAALEPVDEAQRQQAVARSAAELREAEGRRLGRRPLWQRPDPVDEAALAREAERLGRLLRTRYSRRWRHAEHGRVDLRATVARAARTGGVPWRLVRRRRRIARPRLLLLCDVSGSVRRSSELLLRMVHQLGRISDRPAGFVFVDRPVDATPLFRCADFDDALAALDDLAGLDRQALSDFGHVFAKLLSDHADLLGPRTCLVVLGDARCNRFDPGVWALEDIARRCARVVWLNPERAGRWYTADSALRAYSPAIDHLLPAETLEDLAAGLEVALTAATRGPRIAS